MFRPPIVARFIPVCAAAVLMLFLTPGAALSQSGSPPLDLSEQARSQLRAIYAEKASRTPAQKKLSTQLVYAVRELAGDPAMIGIPRLADPRVEQARVQGLSIEVDITADVSEALLQEIRDLGGRIVNSFAEYRAIRAFLPLSAIATLAERGDVTRIREAAQPFTNKINTTQGDVAHRANVARSTFGVNGAGVKVGVLSDSIDALASLQGSGDLPAVNVISGQSGNPGSSEGTAMLEIVHDLAPGAQLWFATAYDSEANFANNIKLLAQNGCKVIVDDVGYFAEPAFQDGIVAQAVDYVASLGVSYFSSAGNSGSKSWTSEQVWEGDFTSAGTLDFNDGENATDGTVASFSGAQYNSLTSGTHWMFLQWSDPWGTAANDYDLCFVNQAGTSVEFCSVETQDGSGIPLEEMGCPDCVIPAGSRFYVINYEGTQAPRFLRLYSTQGELSVGTQGQLWGHTAANGAFSVAAVDVAKAGGGVFTGGSGNPIEDYSSDGPRRVFYNADGSPITPGNYLSSGGALRQKPDIAAADGVATATPDFDDFHGTSAAAPHAAGIAALMLQAKPGATPAQVRQAFASTSLDIMAPGVDRDSGYGIVDAAEAVEAIAGGGNPGPCVRDSRTACLLNNRFEVRVSYTTVSASGNAQVMSFNGARAESNQSAFYYFFDNANFEMGIKMQDACVAPFNKYWVFVSGLTNQGYTVTVRDSVTGSTKTYSNPLGSYPQTVGDTSALNCLMAPPGVGETEILGFVPIETLNPQEELGVLATVDSVSGAGDVRNALPEHAAAAPPSAPSDLTSVAISGSLEAATTAANLHIDGSWSWQISSGQVQMTVNNVVNSGTSTSGNLGLVLWASSSPVAGGSITGHQLGSCTYSPLPAGNYYATLTCNGTYTPPPAGCYYVTILLLEQQGADWYYVDWVSDNLQQGLNGGSCSGGGGSCVRSPTKACLLGGRFEVTVNYQTASASGNAGVMSFSGQRTESDQSVFYYFFDNANFEMGVKMQNACVPPFNQFWAFVSGLTNQGYTVTIRDTSSGRVKTYSNPLGTYPQTVGDTSAFPCP